MTKPNTLAFLLEDDFNGREVVLRTTLTGDNIECHYEAFHAFLLAIGFVKESIDRYMGEE